MTVFLLTCPVGEVLERGALAAADVALDEDGVGPLEAGNVAAGRGPFHAAVRNVVCIVFGGAAENVSRIRFYGMACLYTLGLYDSCLMFKYGYRFSFWPEITIVWSKNSALGCVNSPSQLMALKDGITAIMPPDLLPLLLLNFPLTKPHATVKRALHYKA